MDERCFNCYLFKAHKPISDNGLCFDLPTFVYGDEIDVYNVETIESNYTLNKNYTLEGKRTVQEFSALKNVSLIAIL